MYKLYRKNDHNGHFFSLHFFLDTTLLGSTFKPSYIQNHLIMNCLIKRFQSNMSTSHKKSFTLICSYLVSYALLCLLSTLRKIVFATVHFKAPDKIGYQVNIFLISPQKLTLLVLIRSASMFLLRNKKNEPAHDKTYKKACAPSKDQLGHLPMVPV